MKTIKIAYLYYDLMNLYGENGNVRYLVNMLKEQDIDVKVDYLSIEDKITSDYDLYYMGTGSEENYELAKEHINKYKKEIVNALDNNKYFIVTGNSLDLFCIDSLDIFPFKVELDNNRFVGEQYYKSNIINHSIIGFMNKSTELIYEDNNKEFEPLFEVIDGYGYDYSNKKYDGIKYKNFYGTSLIGPFLVRNPYFTDYLIEDICKFNDIKYKKGKRDTSPYLAYTEYLKNFYEKLNS